MADHDFSEDESLLEATNKAIKAATHLQPKDRGAVQALRMLARKIDTMDDFYQALCDDYESRGLRPPSQDNVSIPTYLRYSESLGLTPKVEKAPAKRTPVKKEEDAANDKPAAGPSLSLLRGGLPGRQ